MRTKVKASRAGTTEKGWRNIFRSLGFPDPDKLANINDHFATPLFSATDIRAAKDAPMEARLAGGQTKPRYVKPGGRRRKRSAVPWRCL